MAGAHELIRAGDPRDNAAEVSTHGVEAVVTDSGALVDNEVSGVALGVGQGLGRANGRGRGGQRSEVRKETSAVDVEHSYLETLGERVVSDLVARKPAGLGHWGREYQGAASEDELVSGERHQNDNGRQE